MDFRSLAVVKWCWNLLRCHLGNFRLQFGSFYAPIREFLGILGLKTKTFLAAFFDVFLRHFLKFFWCIFWTKRFFLPWTLNKSYKTRKHPKTLKNFESYTRKRYVYAVFSATYLMFNNKVFLMLQSGQTTGSVRDVSTTIVNHPQFPNFTVHGCKPSKYGWYMTLLYKL